MREFVYSILDLNNRIWPQMLDIDRPVQHLIPGLAQKLDLPRELNYVLIPAGSNQALDGRYTLAQVQVPVGTQLFLRPVRDSLLKQLLDKLYDQAKDELKDQLLDRAREKLKKIFDLDPSYPDPLYLKERAWGQPAQAQYQQQSPRALPPVKKGIKTGWIITGVLGGGAVLIGGAVTVVAIIVMLARGALDRASRNEPILGTGDVQVTLRWDAPVDLDLHVIDPAGTEIWYQTPVSSSGGLLDVDANGNCQGMASSPVENVYWPLGGAPSGGYQVLVIYYMSCGYSGPVDYEVTVKQNNQVVNVLTGTLNDVNESQRVTRFER